MSFETFKESNPFVMDDTWKHKSGFFVVDSAIRFIWFVRIVSIGAWISSIFSYRADTGKIYGRPLPTEIFLIAVFALGILFQFPLALQPGIWNGVIVVFSALILLDIFQYHFYLFFIRPRLDSNYTQYNSVRTIILTVMGYLNVVNYFAVIYRRAFGCSFEVGAGAPQYWVFSTGQISSAGSAVNAETTDGWLMFAIGTEQLAGVMFLAMFISMALNSLNRPEL